MSSEDVFKESSRRLGQDQCIRLGYTSAKCLQDVFKASSRRLVKISQVLVYYFTTPLSTTPFSDVLTEVYLESGGTSTTAFFCRNTEQL